MKQLTFLTLFAVIIATATGCLKARDNDNKVDWDSTMDEAYVLTNTNDYVQNINNRLEADQIADNVVDLETAATTSPELKIMLSDLNSHMASSGFDNFDHSAVHKTANQTLFYSVYRNGQNSTGNRDMCMAFMKDGDEEPISVIEGPGTVGMDLTMSVAGDNFTGPQMQEMFVPVQNTSQGFGSFDDGLSTESYKTEAGTVSISYERGGNQSGVIFVQAEGTVGEGDAATTYRIDHQWRITY